MLQCICVNGYVLEVIAMKKILALLLVLSMLFTLAACGGESKKDDKSKIIGPSASEEDIYLHDNTWGDIKLIRVTTASRNDAEELLDLITDYLTSLGMTSKIKSLYIIPNVSEDYAEETLFVRVYFEDSSVDYVYVSIHVDKTKYNPGKICVGSFRDADVKNEEYINTAFEKTGDYADKLANDLGIGSKRTDVSGIFFPLYMTRDLSFELPAESHEKLMRETMDAYDKYVHAGWSSESEPGGVSIDGMYYQKIVSDTIKSYDDLRNFRMTYFTEFVADEIEARFGMTEGDHPIYLEKDGALYFCPIGMGGPFGYKGPKVKYVAEKDGYLFMLIEGEWTDFDDDYNPTTPYYTYDMFVYEKDTSGTWKCDCYEDIGLRQYESVFYR